MSETKAASSRQTNVPDAGRTRIRLTRWLWPLLILVVAALALLALNGEFLTRLSQERDLIDAGKRIRDAIGAYHENSPGTAKTYPSALQHLLLDPRILGEKKYLDYIPTDPLTRKSEWGEIKNPQGEVIGVHSLATGTPTWLGQLLAPGGSGSGAYARWKFVHEP